MTSFRGAYTALVTPMKNGRVDDAALTRLVDAQIEGGIDGLVPCGTTGESATLSNEEHLHVVEVVVRANKGRVPVLAGAGSNATHEAIELTRKCKELGVDGTLQVTPYYNRPPQAGLIQHFEAIANAVPLPIVLYNVPARTGIDMLPETVAACAQHESIVGIKEATGDMHRAARVRELCGPDFSILSGDDFSVLGLLAAGGDGVISVVTNVAPELLAKMCAAMTAGDIATARQLNFDQLPLTRMLFEAPNPIPTKACLHMMGVCENENRSPLTDLDLQGELAQKLRAKLQDLGKL